jgi:Flp pilus assembly protein TadG
MFELNGFGREAKKSGQAICLSVDSKGRRLGIGSVVARVDALLRSKNEGQALVEMAITLPLLLILLMCIYTFGVAYSNKVTLTNAVGQASITLQSSRGSTADPCATAWNALTAAAPGLNSAQINMSISFNGGTPVAGSTCTGSLATFAGTVGQTNTISATYPCNLLLYGRSIANCTISAATAAYQF